MPIISALLSEGAAPAAGWGHARSSPTRKKRGASGALFSVNYGNRRCGGTCSAASSLADYTFLAGFFFAGLATAVTVLLLLAPALPATFFDMAIAFSLRLIEPRRSIIRMY